MGHAFLAVPGVHGTGYRCAKIGYQSRRDAMKALRTHRPPTRLAAAGSGAFSAYHCDQCGLWHLGHAVKGRD